MKQYLDLVNHILENGIKKEDRTGTGTLSIFGYQMRFDLKKGFPLLTTKRVPFKTLVASELLWFIKGDTNIRFLLQHNNTIWDEWAFKNYVESDEYTGQDMNNFASRKDIDEAFAKEYEKEIAIFHERILTDDEFASKFGDLGSIYGKQWRRWSYYDKDENGHLIYHEIDQLKNVIEEIKTNPNSRRLIVNAWNVGDFTFNKMALPPCHVFFQFNIMNGKLNSHLYQRSIDVFLGCPFNISSYALLTHMVAQVCDLEVGEFIYSMSDCHIYLNHIEQVQTQLKRETKQLPQLILDESIKCIDDFTLDSINLVGYNPHPSIKASVSV